jgi:hypothetical protein
MLSKNPFARKHELDDLHSKILDSDCHRGIQYIYKRRGSRIKHEKVLLEV